ncbi:2-C-methyl-D-erythritol 4-phosphate cytidylyltransferase [Akkermansiaceae bacterium]|jgi:2-C-methyl-D-erythritol 4-phosphate cytidylyltransferase|nr:2-C-methyl-D-erythritol 4-phosphate cytidylyltransferase [Akkermansiaceae bacterium]MDA7530383.1 2-C-methyl-D-erythritol 4-phosphate cytidylyltransferase [bacterium]MDA7663308.1 2-C-methyl-D-erythritol 4-phosphate cytidylyltransferase [Akkermansiaceae bacterium]MDA7671179.1 2-C-methyl-D-erythritol 4-phosphate cytidylyltransferase [Akkermansiaceae bacterium]MDB4450254.1 2-C-methyl-D-erythritol 4-phosphate cytidylyltransferase [Akkermansiaceae bacterium]
MSFAAIIVASGSSQRMGFDKLAAQWRGKTILWHSVHAFSSLEEISQVIVVTPPDRFAWLADLGPKLNRVNGGRERSDSVAAGLMALRNEISHVAIHDGARPLVSPESIRATFAAAEATKAASLARRVTETLKRATPEGITSESVSRDNLWVMETPQIFSRDLIHKAYQSVSSGDTQITDEVSALQLLNQGTTLVENPSPNPKITIKADLDALP